MIVAKEIARLIAQYEKMHMQASAQEKPIWSKVIADLTVLLEDIEMCGD